MRLIGYLLSLVVTGLIVGALGRLAVPGRNPLSIPATIGIGIVGAFIGGLIAAALHLGIVLALILEVAAAALIVTSSPTTRGCATDGADTHGRANRRGRARCTGIPASRLRPDVAAHGRRHARALCICAEGVTDAYPSGGWFHSEGHENGPKRPIVNAA
jgi:uncharacterized membrane protein YeaQ/YmgE (transglycosylase-associated protein family)